MDTVDFSRARCKGRTKLFFTDTVIAIGRAKDICYGGCPIRGQCLDYALTTRQEHGVWGGLSEQERTQRQRAVRPGGCAPTDVTYTTNARSTGATCSAGRTETGWAVVCRAHGSTAVASSRTVAEYAVSRPEEWCGGCAKIASGQMPKANATL